MIVFYHRRGRVSCPRPRGTVKHVEGDLGTTAGAMNIARRRLDWNEIRHTRARTHRLDLHGEALILWEVLLAAGADRKVAPSDFFV
jgi:hypothetical protein